MNLCIYQCLLQVPPCGAFSFWPNCLTDSSRFLPSILQNKNSVWPHLNCMDGSVLAFLNCTDRSIWSDLNCTDGSVWSDLNCTDGSVWSDLNLEFCIGTQSAPTKFVQMEFSDIPCLLCKKSTERTYLRYNDKSVKLIFSLLFPPLFWVFGRTYCRPPSRYQGNDNSLTIDSSK